MFTNSRHFLAFRGACAFGKVLLILDVSIQVARLSCYGLKIEEGTPLDRKKDALRIPDDDEQAEEYLATVELLEKAGYAQYEISNFARPGRESRHNLKYWTMQEYLGFGPGAHSDFGGRVDEIEAHIVEARR